MSNFDLVATLKANVSNFTRGMKEAQASVDNLQKNTDSSFDKIGGSMKSAGKAMTIGLTLPLAALATAAVRTGAEFDDQMSTVAAVTGASADEMEMLSRAARDMGRDTRYSATEAAQAQENLARAGFTTSEIMNALGSTLNLATAGALSLDDASSIAAQTIRGFGLEASDAERVADTLAYTSAATNTTVGGLGETFKYVAPIAAALGIEMEEVAAAAGIMGDAGIEAGQAGNMLKRGLLNLSGPTKQQADLMNDLGMNMFDAEGNMKPLVEVIGELENGLEGMDAKQRTAALSTLFGAEAVSGWTALINEGSGSLQELQNEIEGADGFAQDFAETAEDNLAGSMRSLKSSWAELMITISDGVSGPLRGLVDMLADVINWLSSLDESTQQTIIMVAGLVAALGPLLFVFGALIQKIPAIVTGFKLMGAAIAALFSPIGLIIAALAAFVAMLIYLWNTNEEFRVAVIEIWNGIKEGIQAAWEALSAYLEPAVQAIADFVMEIFGGLAEWWKENNEMFLQVAQNVWNLISTVIQTTMSVIMSIMQTVWPYIRTLIELTWKVISNVIETTVGVILGVIQLFAAVLNGDFEGIKAGLTQIWTSLWDGIKNHVSIVIEAIRSIISITMESIRETISSILESIRDTFQRIWDAIVTAVTVSMTKVVEAVTSGIQGAYDAVVSFFGKFKEAGANIMGNVADGIKGAVGKVTGAVKDVMSKARDLLPFSPPKDKSSPLADIHKNGIIEQVAKGIHDDESSLQKAMNSALSLVSEEVGTVDINGEIARSNAQVNSTVSHEINDNVNKQPAYLNLNIGGQNFTAFVENISDAQNKKIRLESAFGL